MTVDQASFSSNIKQHVCARGHHTLGGHFGYCIIIEVVPLFSAFRQANSAGCCVMTACHAAKMVADSIQIVVGIRISWGADT